MLVITTVADIGMSLLLKELRWLSIEKRLEEKPFFTITFKARNGVAPSYLTELLN